MNKGYLSLMTWSSSLRVESPASYFSLVVVSFFSHGFCTSFSFGAVLQQHQADFCDWLYCPVDILSQKYLLGQSKMLTRAVMIALF